MYELYETEYGILNHTNNKNPLGAIRFNESENFMKEYLYDSYLMTYLHKQIGKLLNLSFDEYLNRPKYQIDAIHRTVDEYNRIKQKAETEEINKLQNAANNAAPNKPVSS